MTAVLGILNKQGVAIAADSAVTIGNSANHKILNKANKVFALSKHHPVGIMIYNSASFMLTPWETIIKMYRKHIGEVSFPTLRGYVHDFIAFLRERQFFTDDETQKNFLAYFAFNIIESIINNVFTEHNIPKENPTQEDKDSFIRLFEESVDSVTHMWNQKDEGFDEFTEYTLENFTQYSNDIFDRIKEERFTQNEIDISDPLFEKIKLMIYSVLIKKEEISSFTGLIFTGFGEDEIYPSLIPIDVFMVIDNRLRFFYNDERAAAITNKNSGVVCPFAQTDVIDTILSGIDPSLDEIYLSNFRNLLERYNTEILDRIGDTNPLLTEQIRNLDTGAVVQEFRDLNRQITIKNYIGPLMNAVSNLAKEDLAEMAESLIYLTNLKRRITFAEESVGGPVDVAIISKGDGFIWIKRKHYFKPELNQHFLNNYLS